MDQSPDTTKVHVYMESVGILCKQILFRGTMQISYWLEETFMVLWFLLFHIKLALFSQATLPTFLNANIGKPNLDKIHRFAQIMGIIPKI